jgi:hypothetical protein
MRGVHLQCHIGTDTISLARLGATMTVLDFSGAAIAEARRLSATCGTAVEFVEADVYDAAPCLRRERSIRVHGHRRAVLAARRAAVGRGGRRAVAPGGGCSIREGHPVLWSIDERQTDRLVIGYPYFERAEPLVDDAPGTYVPPMSSSPTTPPTAGITDWARSSPPC